MELEDKDESWPGLECVDILNDLGYFLIHGNFGHGLLEKVSQMPQAFKERRCI